MTAIASSRTLRLFRIVALRLLVSFRKGRSIWSTTASSSSSSSSLPSSPTKVDEGTLPVITLTDSTFDDILESSDNLLVLFKANKCPPCRKMEPEYDLLADDDDLKSQGVTVASIDVPTNKESSIRFGIRVFPSLVYFRNGNMYRYEEKNCEYSSMKSFVMNGYDKIGNVEPIPPKPTSLSQFGLFRKALWIEMHDAALGNSGMAGYVMIMLMGLLIGLLCFVTVFVAVLIKSGVVGGGGGMVDNNHDKAKKQ